MQIILNTISLIEREGQTTFWNWCAFGFFDHRWNMTKESSSTFSTTKAYSQTKFISNLKRNARMIFTVSVAFNVDVSTFGKGEKIKNDEVSPSLDSSTRNYHLP
jgi:hypothetical protein